VRGTRRKDATYNVCRTLGKQRGLPHPGSLAGQIRVRLGSPTATPSFTFTNTDGLDIIDAGTNTDFLFVDQVPAALKPTTLLPGPGGIWVQAEEDSNATLRIDTGQTNDDDRSYSITQRSTTSTRVRITDVTLTIGDAHIGTGVTNLVIRTNDFDEPTGYWPPSSGNADPGSAVNVTTLAQGINLTVNTGASTYPKSRSAAAADSSTTRPPSSPARATLWSPCAARSTVNHPCSSISVTAPAPATTN
jgi:hypothetical protein